MTQTPPLDDIAGQRRYWANFTNANTHRPNQHFSNGDRQMPHAPSITRGIEARKAKNGKREAEASRGSAG